MPYHKTYKIPYQKTLSRILKKCLIMSKKDTLSKKPHQESKKGALSRNLIKNLHKILKKVPYQRTLKRM